MDCEEVPYTKDDIQNNVGHFMTPAEGEEKEYNVKKWL